MKKRMIAITPFATLFFVISIGTALPSWSKPSTKVVPKSQQQPSTVQIQQQVKAKDKFWGLEVDHCVVGVGVVDGFNPCSSTINIKKGSMTGKCYYKVKTPPINDITAVDAKCWGTGKSYTISASLINDDTQKSLKEEKNKKLPQFTWADVQKWKSAGQGNVPKIWTELLYFVWIATPEYIGSNSFSFEVDKTNVIEEYDGVLNNKCSGIINITP